MLLKPRKKGHMVLKRQEPEPYFQMNAKRLPPDLIRRRIIYTLIFLAVLIWVAYLIWGIYTLERGV